MHAGEVSSFANVQHKRVLAKPRGTGCEQDMRNVKYSGPLFILDKPVLAVDL